MNYKVYRSRRDIILTLISFIYFIVTTYIGSLAVAAADRLNPNSALPPEKKSAPLFDPLYNGLSNIRNEIDKSINYQNISANHAPIHIVINSTNSSTTISNRTIIPHNVDSLSNSTQSLLSPSSDNSHNSVWSILFPWKTLSDILIILCLLMIFIRTFSLGKFSLTFLRRNLIIIGTLYFIRAPFLVLTVIPTPVLSCISKPVSPIALDALMIQFQFRKACGDVFWSGHSIIYTIALLNWVSKAKNYFYLLGHFHNLSQIINLESSESDGIEMEDVIDSSISSATNSQTSLVEHRHHSNMTTTNNCPTLSTSSTTAHFSQFAGSFDLPQPAHFDIENHNAAQQRKQTWGKSYRNSFAGSTKNPNDLNPTRPSELHSNLQHYRTDNTNNQQRKKIFSKVLFKLKNIPNDPVLKVKAISTLDIIFQILAWLFWIEGCLSLIYGTLHYTIDVVIGVLFSCSIWYIYHLGIFYDPIFRHSKLFQWTVLKLENV